MRKTTPISVATISMFAISDGSLSSDALICPLWWLISWWYPGSWDRRFCLDYPTVWESILTCDWSLEVPSASWILKGLCWFYCDSRRYMIVFLILYEEPFCHINTSQSTWNWFFSMSCYLEERTVWFGEMFME